MTRSFLIGLAVLLGAACGNKTFDSLCAAQIPAPAGCDTACNPSQVASCPAGYHCSSGGKCDLFCTATGNECGDGYRCTADGNCVKTGGGGGSDVPDAACPALHFTPTRTTPTVELLLDQSSSMSQNYGPNNTPPTRMNAMKSALIDPTNGVVAKLAPSVIFGVSLYTGTGASPPDCPTLASVPRALNNFQAIRDLLNPAPPRSNTPTGASIDAVVASFMANPPPASSPKIIVLATDGLPDTCADQNPPQTTPPDPPSPRQLAANATTVEAARRASAAGIKLFFLFIGDPAQARNHPQEMANAGAGVVAGGANAPFFVATNPTQLTEAFDTIIGGVVSCDLRLDTELDPADAPAGIVKIDNRTLEYQTEWNLDDDGITIHILGDACTMLKSATNPVVDAAFPCGSIIE
jgi:hypothetical protein